MELDKESSPTDDNLRTDESRKEIASGLSTENASATQVASAKEIPCNECATSFSSLQKYMEHHCPNARLPLLKDENESEISDLEDSDVENLTGEIVYQPDGSAFILEDSKESGQNAQPGAKSLFSPAMFPNSKTSAGDKTEQSAAAPMSFYPQAGFAFLKGSASSAASADQPLRSTQMPKAEINLGGLSASAMKAPIGSGSLNHSSPGARDRDQESNCERQKDVSTLHSNGEFPIKSEPGEPVDADEDEDAYSNELDDDGVGELADSTSSKDFPLLNQSISPLSSSVLKYTEKGTSSSSVTVSDDVEKTKQTAAPRDSSNDTNNYSGSGKDYADSSGGRDGTPPFHPNDLLRRDDESPGPPHQHTATPGTPGTGEGSPGSGIECPKCDTVLGSSRSLGGHMTMMHSRNSCKTLKCPKCNWHYKYQQTLDAHMKEKHPESGGTCAYCRTGQPHPRLARGESYTCGYKPFRCEVCNYSTTTKGNLSIHMQSDKHLNNVQTLQNGGTEPVYNHSVPVSSASLSGCGTPSPSKPKQKPTWRCEVCDYETNVARNLRIHMTSEKHMHNMMLLQQNMKQIQHNLHLGLAPAEAELYQYYLAQNIGLTGMKLENPADPQMMISPFQLDPTSAAAALAPGLVNNELLPEIRLASGQLMGDDLSVLSAGELSPYISDPLLKLFQCAVCNKFTSDSLEALSAHVNTERSLPEEEWRAVIGDIYQCKLCNYNTQLKANFQLHCKTDKHMQKYQLVAHIKEGGKPNQWRLKCIAIGNPVHLKCNACDYYSNSVEKLRLHATNQRHEAALKLYKHLQKQESALNSESCYYYCALCDYSTKAKLNLVQHLRSVKHQQTDGLRKLQLHQQGLPPDEDNLADLFFVKDCLPNESEEPGEDAEGPPRTATVAAVDDKDLTEKDSKEEKKTEKDSRINTLGKETPGTTAVGKRSLLQEKENDAASKRPRSAEEKTASNEQVQQCPYCNYSSKDTNRIQMHVMSQHSMQPVICCPLCQDVLSNKIHLQLHLTHLHSVAPDCVEKLLMTVSGPDVMTPSNMLLPATVQDKVPSQMDMSTVTPEGSGKPHGDSSNDEKNCTVQDKGELELQNEEFKPPKEASEAPDWKKSCVQELKNPDSLQEHLSELQKRQQLSVSDRHVYKYRCNHCSLAFKTMQKLQIHSQYHAIRAATMCSLCQRSFRTFLALRKHLESGHPELSEAEVQQLCGSLPLNGDFCSESEARAFEEAQAFEQEMDKDEDLDQEGKASPTGSDSSSLLDDMGSEPKRTLPFRKGPNFTMEKFLDPSRPYKCTVWARGNAAKALLENFGFELVIQYNENRQKSQKKNRTGEEESQFKRPRTRITDDQLKILRAHFDINNSPNEEQIQEMADKSGLPQKVIKHWFRNTLFKERQRSKDSPYNFSIPPITTLEDVRIESQFSALEYYRTDAAMNKRSSRTRFTDYQLRVLQDFFDTNAYPKDDEIEQLSTVLNLPTRVIVVWFQNARQKARKSYENQADAKDKLWQEHQHMHFLAAQNQFLHSQFLERPLDMPYMIFDPNNPLMTGQLLAGALSQMPTQSSSSLSTPPCSGSSSLKRKLDEKEEISPNDKDGGNSGEDQHRDKRLRTTITPEQLEILYDKYLLDSNPTRKMLDHIAREVGLKKRVVQVWFQNTRARERKGQFRALGPAQSHKKCPFCRALFKAKSALDSHIRSRHWHEAKQAGFSLPPSPMMAHDDGGESPNKNLWPPTCTSSWCKWPLIPSCFSTKHTCFSVSWCWHAWVPYSSHPLSCHVSQQCPNQDSASDSTTSTSTSSSSCSSSCSSHSFGKPSD
ncbi:hypothetical protein MATL_G00036030 [Megalops atlanticus]|uniref:Zinc finger homeobox protein 4 n=1 Tax=Megalops atlanticus TaxID=7932 RepID=A0A9D3TCK7_MEGAT|nr:hypothetical protein MATL_G00036030 [Megalops atlanticus]